MEKYQDRFLEEVREKFKVLGIKAVLFDLDDTLIYTQELFINYMKEFVAVVAEETGKSVEEVKAHLEAINNEEYKKMGVNPDRWGAVVKRMGEEVEGYGDSPVRNLDILMKIYYQEPRVKSGAKAILEILRMAGIKIALVTHANVEWTHRKLESTGLDEYFETVNIIDENGHKKAEHWAETMIELGVGPDECLVLGDNLTGDILAGHSLGSRTMWLRSGSSWSVYRTGNVPEETVLLDEINQLLLVLEGVR